MKCDDPVAHGQYRCRCCIVPPHMLEAIIKNGDAEQRIAAAQTLHLTEQMRLERLSLVGEAGPAQAADETAGAAHKSRKIYTAANGTGLPGNLVRSEGQGASGDAEIDEAYNGLGATFDLYNNVFQRNSIDNAGMDLIGTTHYGVKYNNAFWNGSQMVFGDGDGKLFNRFTIAIDVMGHELTHGVTQYTAKLVYSNQSGALNESVSDVFGSMVKQYALGQTSAQADWLIGAGLLAAGVKGVALRSMKAPGTAYDDPVLGKDPQPDHMSKYVNTTSDNGGVHINSGIPNKAFYLTSIALGGNSWDRAGHIWYNTLLDSRLSASAQFQDFANLTVDNANKLYGATVGNAVVQAWQQVGINVAAIVSWQNNKAVLSTYTSPHSMNAWAYIQDNGWRKVQSLTPDGVTNTFALLVDAQSVNARVNVYLDGTTIYQAYSV